LVKRKKGHKKRKGHNVAAFCRGRKAALAAGWKPFTKMSAKQKSAFRSAYHKA